MAMTVLVLTFQGEGPLMPPLRFVGDTPSHCRPATGWKADPSSSRPSTYFGGNEKALILSM